MSIYGTEVLCLVGTPDNCRKYSEKSLPGSDFSDDNGSGYATGLRLENGGFIYVMRVSPSENFGYFIATVAHEALHLAWHILTNLGIVLDSENHEAQAYLMDYLVQTIVSEWMIPEKKKRKP